MPLVRIELRDGKASDYRLAIGEVVYDALIGIGVPANDRFQVITEHAKGGLISIPATLGSSDPRRWS